MPYRSHMIEGTSYLAITQVAWWSNSRIDRDYQIREKRKINSGISYELMKSPSIETSSFSNLGIQKAT